MLSGDRVVGYEEIARITLPAARRRPGSRSRAERFSSFTDTAGLTLGRRYVYVVTAEDATGRSSPPSERLVVTFFAAPVAPPHLTAQAGDAEARLTWKPALTLIDGKAGRGRNPLRGPSRRGGRPLAPVTPTPIAETSFTDKGLTNDTTYSYAVRTVRVEPEATAIGPCRRG